MSPRPARRTTATHELAVLADGPWALRWYWRDNLEEIQAATLRYPDDKTAAQHRHYEPTEEWRDNPQGHGVGRVWRYRDPATGRPAPGQENVA